MADPCCCRLDLELDEDALALDVADVALEWGSDEYVRVVNVTTDEYDGPYDATPSSAAQTFHHGQAHDGRLHRATDTKQLRPSHLGRGRAHRLLKELPWPRT